MSIMLTADDQNEEPKFDMKSLPEEGLFLGVASDGYPVLMNIYDGRLGPVAIIGSYGDYLQKFLQGIYKAAERTHTPEDLTIAVITGFWDDWENFEGKNCTQIVTPATAKGLITSLYVWARSGRRLNAQRVLLIIDSLSDVRDMDNEMIQMLTWILKHGSNHHIYPVVAIHADDYRYLATWMHHFRVRIFGKMDESTEAMELFGVSLVDFSGLDVQTEYLYEEEGSSWIRFTAPAVKLL